jgi:hypothetical protein
MVCSGKNYINNQPGRRPEVYFSAEKAQDLSDKIEIGGLRFVKT